MGFFLSSLLVGFLLSSQCVVHHLHPQPIPALSVASLGCRGTHICSHLKSPSQYEGLYLSAKFLGVWTLGLLISPLVGGRAPLRLYAHPLLGAHQPLNFSNACCTNDVLEAVIADRGFSEITAVTFFTLFALIPRSPACFALMVASFINLHPYISLTLENKQIQSMFEVYSCQGRVRLQK